MKSNKSVKSAITGLTVNEEAFAQLLAKGYDKANAYYSVYGIGRGTKKTRQESACKLAKKHNITTYIEKLAEDTRARGVIDRDWIIEKLTLMANFGTETQMKYDKIGNQLEEFKDSSAANSAMDKLIKMGGLYAAEKIETEHKVKGKFVLNLRARTDT